MITAMFILIITLAVAVVLTIATIRLVLHDGPGAQRPPASHFTDSAFLPPGARG